MNTPSEKKTTDQIRLEGEALIGQAEAMLEKLTIHNIRLSQQVKQLKSELEVELVKRNPPEPTA